MLMRYALRHCPLTNALVTYAIRSSTLTSQLCEWPIYYYSSILVWHVVHIGCFYGDSALATSWVPFESLRALLLIRAINF